MTDNVHPAFGAILDAFIENVERKYPTRRRHVEGCSYCEQNKGASMMPSHDASLRCESGKRPHCTCDTCF